MLINKLTIKNFLSLRNISLKLGKLNVLVGPNASGKSNIVKALRTISTIIKNGPANIANILGVKNFKEITFQMKENITAYLSLNMNINGKKISYNLEFMRDGYKETITAEKELLFTRSSTMQGYSCRYKTTDGKLKPASHPISTQRYFNIHIPTGVPLHKFPFPPDTREEILEVKKALSLINSYSFEPSKIRFAAPVTQPPLLGYDGGGLPRVLLHLYLENRKAFGEIESILKSLIPRIEEVVPHIEGTEVILAVREKDIEDLLSPYLISDGTLRLLAFITATLTSKTLVTFEEPENCIHPHLLQSLIDMLRKAPSQVLLTTHSPYLLDHVEPEEVVVVEKINNETKLTKLLERKEIETVKKFLEEGGTLGEAWYSGLFAGV